jgi:anti-sigma factor RsiW
VRCTDARKAFTRRLDGRLTAAERAALDAHLSSCGGCRAGLARWEAAAIALRALGPTAAPAGLAERAYRAAMAGGARAEPVPLAASFVGAARRAVLGGAALAAAVWLGVLATGDAPASAPAPTPASGAEDPMELALQLQLWAPEGGDDAR